MLAEWNIQGGHREWCVNCRRIELSACQEVPEPPEWGFITRKALYNLQIKEY